MLPERAHGAERAAVPHVVPLGDEDPAGQVVVAGAAVRGGERLIRLGPVLGRAAAEPPEPLRDVIAVRPGGPTGPRRAPAAARRPRAEAVQVAQPGQAGVAEPVQFQQAIDQKAVMLVTELEGARPGAGQVERDQGGGVGV